MGISNHSVQKPKQLQTMKIFVCVSIAALFCGSTFAQLSKDVSKKFKDEEVVKDVLSKVPKSKLKVEYVDEDISAEFGNTLGVSKTQSIPKVSYEAADAKKMYTLAMVDPDAPSRQDPKAAQWLHWLVVNVPGENMKSGENIDYGKVLMQHNGPAPPQGSGNKKIFKKYSIKTNEYCYFNNAFGSYWSVNQLTMVHGPNHIYTCINN